MAEQKTLVNEMMDVLKEQKELFALMGAYVAMMVGGVIYWNEIKPKLIAAADGNSIWLFYAFAFLPVLIPVAVVVAKRLRRASLEKRLGDMGQEQLAFKHAHFRTAPYGSTEEDRAAYGRTDRAHEEALDRIRKAAAKAEPFFFLHSQSGCGKTSLLQAYALPELEKSGWRVISLRGFTGILPELAEALGLPETAPAADIHAALVAEAAARRQAGGTLLVAVDQFEEFLILHPPGTPAWDAVGAWLTGQRRAPAPGLLVLLSFRSEYQALALKLGLPDFHPDCSYVVPLFTAEDAREFLRQGLEAARQETGPLPLDQFIRQMEDRDDTRGMVRPIQANLVGHAYRTFAAEFHRRLLAGRRVDFLGDWLQRLLERRELRLHARPVFGGLLQADGSRSPARVSAIAAESGLEPEQVRSCLSAFQAEGLVRCLTPELADDKEKLWEISHDFLAIQIKRLLSFWRRLWQEKLARAVAPAALGLWLVLAAGFLMQDTDSKARIRLQELGFSWHPGEKRAAVDSQASETFTSTELGAAGPLLRTLGCRKLQLSNCRIENVDGLRGLITLTELELLGCNNLERIDGLRGLTALAKLRLSSPKLERVDDLRGLIALTSLELTMCEKLADVEPLEGLVRLQVVALLGCQRLSQSAVENLRTALPNAEIEFH